MVSYGARILGAYKPLSLQTLQLDASVPGEIYEIAIETTGIPDADNYNNSDLIRNQVISLFLQELPLREPTAKIKWVNVDDIYVRIQIEGSPFFWATFVAFLPQILALIGIGVAGLSVWTVITTIPGWVWGGIVFGVGLIFFGPTLSNLISNE